MVKKSSLMSKVLVLMMAFAVVFAYSVMPVNSAFAASAKKPAKVTIKTAKAVSATSVKVTWKKAKNAKKYQVYTSTKKSSGFKKAATVKSSKKTATVKKLKAGTKYYFKVRAINGKKKGKFSKVKAAKTKANPAKEATANEFSAYLNDSDPTTVLVDARTSDSYAGWALGEDKKGGHFKGAVLFSALWLDTDYASDPRENKTRDESIKMELDDSGITTSSKIIVYDTNGTDAVKVANYLTGKGYDAKFYNAAAVLNAASDLESYAKYDMYVPAEVVKSISDYKLGKSELSDNAKKIIGSTSKDSVKIIHAEWWGKRDADGNVDFTIPEDWGSSMYYGTGHVPGAIPVSTDDFEPERSQRADDKVIHQDGVTYAQNSSINWAGDYLLVSDEKLVDLANKFGVKKNDCVVVVGYEPMSTCKIALVLKYMGINNVHVMSAAYNEWNNKGYDLEKTVNAPVAGTDITSMGNPDLIDTQDEVAAMIKDTDKNQVIDTRTVEEFAGKDSGYGYHDIAGRIPGVTINSPSGIGYSSGMYYYRNPDKSMRSKATIDAMWKAQGIDTSKHLSFFCGSGWRAAEETWDALALGYDASMYNDGWQGWSNAGRPFIDKDGKALLLSNGKLLPAYVAMGDEWETYGITADEIKTTDLLVDVRPLAGDNSASKKGYVPGAIQCPVSAAYTEAERQNIMKVYNNAPKNARIVLVCVSGNMLAKNAMAALQASGADMNQVTYLIGGFNNTWSKQFATVSADKTSVSVPAWVTKGDGPDGKLLMLKDANGNPDPAKADLTHHILVNKNGSNAKAAVFNTDTLPIHVYKALQEIGATPSDKYNRADAFDDNGKAKVGTFLDSNAEKIKVSVKVGDSTKSLSDILYHVKEMNSDITDVAKVTTEPFVADMRFSGGKENIETFIDNASGNQTGCITCTFSCWIGTVSNIQYGYSTQEALVNRTAMPATETPVTVVYTK